jgi:lauroyl/myristoyl acyltransferase
VADRKGSAVYAAYRAGALAASAVPAAVGEPAARAIGRMLSRAMPQRRAMAARHLNRASGGRLTGRALDRAVSAAFDSYARYWLEMFRLPSELRREIDRRFRVDGYEHIETALQAGHGVILALPHLGGWEWAGAWAHAVKGLSLLVVVEPVEPPELFDWFVRVRKAMGMEVVPLGPDAASRALGALRDNRGVCLVCDRDLTGDGVEVDFFGERTTMPAGPATLGLRSGAPVLPVAVYFDGRRNHFAIVRPPIDARREGRLRDDVSRMTQDLAHEFEHLIGRAPQQWHLMQPNWPSDRGHGS